jgi:hypothetical protein
MKSFFVKQRVANSKIGNLSIISKIILIFVLLFTFTSPFYCLAQKPITETEQLQQKKDEKIKINSELKTFKETSEAEETGNWVTKGIKSITSFIADEIVGFPIRYIIIPLSKILMAIAGKVLDFSIEYTIYSGSMQNFDKVVKEVWTIIRDVFNLSFIFILLYIAIKKIVGSSSVETKKMLGAIIVSALFINFSFFISRVVIDGGNIVATAFINQITMSDPPKENLGGNIASFVTSLASMQTTKIKLSSSLATGLGIGDIDKALNKTEGAENTKTVRVGLIGLIINLILVLLVTYVFFFLALLIIGRFVMLIFLVAISPIGFIGGAIPSMKRHAEEWRQELINQTILAPVFMLFMLLITKISSIPIKDAGGNSLTYFKYLVVIFFLFKAVGESKRLSGKIGGLADKAATFATGAALAAATGGASLVARQTVGRGAAMLANSSVGKSLQARVAKGGLGGSLANVGLKSIKGTANASMDVRNTDVARLSLGFVQSEGGINLAGSRAKGGGDYGKGKTGFSGWKENRDKTYEEEKIKQVDEVSGLKKSEEKAKALKSTKEAIENQAQQRSEVELKSENEAVKTSKGKLTESNKELSTAQNELLKIEEKDKKTSKDPMSIDRMMINSELKKAKEKVEALKKSNETAKADVKTAEDSLKTSMDGLKKTIASEMGLKGKDGGEYNIESEITKAEEEIVKAVEAKNEFIKNIASKGLFTSGMSAKTNQALAQKLRSQKGSYKPGPNKEKMIKDIQELLGMEDDKKEGKKEEKKEEKKA